MGTLGKVVKDKPRLRFDGTPKTYQKFKEDVIKWTDAEGIPWALAAGNTICAVFQAANAKAAKSRNCLLYTSPSPRDRTRSRMPSSA